MDNDTIFLGNIVSSKIDILNTEKNQQQEELVSYYDLSLIHI